MGRIEGELAITVVFTCMALVYVKYTYDRADAQIAELMSAGSQCTLDSLLPIAFNIQTCAINNKPHPNAVINIIDSALNRTTLSIGIIGTYFLFGILFLLEWLIIMIPRHPEDRPLLRLVNCTYAARYITCAIGMLVSACVLVEMQGRVPVEYAIAFDIHYSDKIVNKYLSCKSIEVQYVNGARQEVGSNCNEIYECRIDYNAIATFKLTNTTHTVLGSEGCYHIPSVANQRRYCEKKCTLRGDCMFGKSLTQIITQHM
jgi:hypothetical protein